MEGERRTGESEPGTREGELGLWRVIVGLKKDDENSFTFIVCRWNITQQKS